MPQSMLTATQPAGRLFASHSSVNRRVPHICLNLADVGRAESPSRISLVFRSLFTRFLPRFSLVSRLPLAGCRPPLAQVFSNQMR